MGLLKHLSTRAPKELDKDATKQETKELKKQLDELQNVLYAESKHAVLVIVQGMDASGKDGVIRKVFSGLNPQGISVKSFKAPTAEELAHDFLWRIHRHAPAKGNIQIFNRSQYEDVLVTRVHGLCDDETARRRFKSINAFEQLLQQDNNTLVLKFYLHLSPERQHERLMERIENPAKNWKYNPQDFKEAKHWNRYREVYEEMFAACDKIPWTIVPADQNWYKAHIIAKTLVESLSALNMQYPSPEKK